MSLTNVKAAASCHSSAAFDYAGSTMDMVISAKCVSLSEQVGYAYRWLRPMDPMGECLPSALLA
jgi:hypothetical protein